ncbi:hypothetical protein A9Q81_15800 [Gammaproteobacteria bacterium 42_54_T18]|nr:hypothetical protein A9Q81_15800 [Gammaproteobacteria bacterium 42_54_T18]
MAGLATACLMAASGKKIIVLEKTLPSGPDTWGDAFDPRVSAITRASENILRQCGAWDFIQTQRISPYTDMDVWDSDGTGNIQFHSSDADVEYLGHIIENRITQYGLYLACQKHKNIEIKPIGLRGIKPHNSDTQTECLWRIELESDEQLMAALVVGADGANSSVRTLTGFATREWDYGHVAIVTTVETEKPHEGIARQPFLTSGPLGFLPLRANPQDEQSCLSSIVWSAKEDYTKTLMAMDEAEFNQALTRAMEGRLGNVIKSDTRFSFPLRQRHAIDYVLPGLALVADAAHTLHPLAGQGINMGFLDVAVLAEEVCSNVAKDLHPAEVMGLRRYQRRRKGHNLLMMSAMEGFKRLFGAEPMPVRLLRNTGMGILNGHYLAKGQILQHAMGFGGDLPAVAKPSLEVAVDVAL